MDSIFATDSDMTVSISKRLGPSARTEYFVFLFVQKYVYGKRKIFMLYIYVIYLCYIFMLYIFLYILCYIFYVIFYVLHFMLYFMLEEDKSSVL